MNRKEFEEAAQRAVYERMLELEKDYVYEPQSISLEFESEIKKLGFEFEISPQVEVICKENPEMTRNIVLRYYDKAILLNEKAYLVSCLSSNYNKDLVPFFLKEYLKKENDNPFISAIGNFLTVNADEKYTEDYISILNMPEEEVKEQKFYIIDACEKLKLKEAIEPMLNLLKDRDRYVYAVIKALKKYRDPQFLPLFQKYLDYKDSDVRRLCKQGIESIEKMLNKKKKDDN